MKQSKFLKNKLVLGVLLLMITVGLTSMTPATDDYDPSGIWDYEVETPQGSISDKLTISKDGDDYSVSVDTAQYGTLELENIELDDTTLSADFDMEGNVIDFEFEFDGDSMEGTVGTPDGEMDITAERRKE